MLLGVWLDYYLMKEKLRHPIIVYGFMDFESFLLRFSSISQDPQLRYLTDAIFHLLLPREAGVEKRFKGGLLIWALWVLQKLTSSRRARGARPNSATASSSSPHYGFRILSTPAHHDSLSPILEQIPRAQRTLYGFGWDGADDGEEVKASDLLRNLSLLRYRESAVALWDAVRTARRLHRILCRMRGKPKGIIRADFSPRMAELVLRQRLELAVLKRMPCPHQAVFLTYELMPEAKAWVQWARESGTRVIHVMHGQWLPTYQVTLATDLLLFSKVDEPWFRERVAPQVKIWTIGHPRLDMIRREVGLPEAPSSPRLPRIAFFSQPSEGDYSRELRRRDWAILAGLKGRAEVRFRPHPRESLEVATMDLKSTGADFIELSEAGLKEDLAWCDAVASSWSTVSMEAAACGRGIFWTCSTPERYEASQELRDHGIGMLLTDAAQWKQPLEDWAHEGWQAPVIVPESRLRVLGMIGDMDIPWMERLGLAPSGFE